MKVSRRGVLAFQSLVNNLSHGTDDVLVGVSQSKYSIGAMLECFALGRLSLDPPHESVGILRCVRVTRSGTDNDYSMLDLRIYRVRRRRPRVEAIFLVLIQLAALDRSKVSKVGGIREVRFICLGQVLGNMLGVTCRRAV